jgi:hypothetical protein
VSKGAFRVPRKQQSRILAAVMSDATFGRIADYGDIDDARAGANRLAEELG